MKYNDKVTLPNEENHKRYMELYQIYRELYGHNKDLFHMIET